MDQKLNTENILFIFGHCYSSWACFSMERVNVPLDHTELTQSSQAVKLYTWHDYVICLIIHLVNSSGWVSTTPAPRNIIIQPNC